LPPIPVALDDLLHTGDRRPYSLKRSGDIFMMLVAGFHNGSLAELFFDLLQGKFEAFCLSVDSLFPAAARFLGFLSSLIIFLL